MSPPPRSEAPRRRPWLRVARTAWLVLLAGLLARVLLTNRAAVADLAEVERPWLLALALLAGFGQLALNASFWGRTLAATGHAVRWRTVLDVTARSVPARYVPGSVWYTLSRAALLRATGVGRGALTVTAVLEAVLTVVVSLTMGGVLLGVAGRLPGRQLTSVAWVIALAAAVTPPVLNRLLAWAARHRGVAAPTLTWGDHAALVGWMAAFWALSAAAFVCYVEAFDLALPSPVIVAGAFLIAWAIGFLTPIAPQGAGAFEVVLVALLVGGANGPLAVVVAGFRALLGIRDAIAFTWGVWGTRRTRDGITRASRQAPAARR